MPVLHNRISNDELKAKMLAESEPRTTISFYKYFTIASPQQTRDALYQVFTALDVFGRVSWRMKASMRKSACRKASSRPFVNSFIRSIPRWTGCV